jgi:hypothetical protein
MQLVTHAYPLNDLRPDLPVGDFDLNDILSKIPDDMEFDGDVKEIITKILEKIIRAVRKVN